MSRPFRSERHAALDANFPPRHNRVPRRRQSASIRGLVVPLLTAIAVAGAFTAGYLVGKTDATRQHVRVILT